MKQFPVLLVALLAALLIPSAVSAHGGHVSTTQTFTQDVGPYEIAVTAELPPTVPSTLYLNVTPPADIGDATITLQAVPRGFPRDHAASTEVRTVPGTQVYFAELPVDRAGDWDIYVSAQGSRGEGQARIPLTITPAEVAGGTWPLLGALGLMMALMVVNVAAAGIARQRGKPMPAALDRVLGYAIFACIVATVIFGVQQFGAQVVGGSANAATSAPAAALGAPHVNVALSTEPASPQAGQPMTLNLRLSDGSTGLPVDDLVPHHDALIHLVLIDDGNHVFAHIHPASTAPGNYTVTTTLPQPGTYTAYAEIERAGSGTQVIARRFEVGGAAGATLADPPGLGVRTIGDLTIDVSANQPPRAGRQTTLTVSVSAQGQLVTDISPWLGMAGHLLTRSADGQILGHIHAVGAMAPATIDTSVAPPVYGPDIRFVYTFPAAGRYYLWAQFQYHGQIVTVPVVLDAAES
ncbi:MAG TPA: hypothetical protein VFT99_11730 [Roseiflexaceae bacterium]|nr:hypothetical protein [Roseiflexaceae bacterium]